ncbi:39S ribosomal protein L43, mitochondrial [Galendromus occidentalis]|uniref:Large ribosomal subunit protein mL43 n=1 Tax=Galendromus occidentalis TaxID=34638 RepID=A0AAJ6QQT0_9ACAR|nr:39S ribosomal protein L43, mitochondrial [Galendromus occidentalis]
MLWIISENRAECSTMNHYKPGFFLKEGFNNGMLQHVPSLARLTFKFCKSHGSSRFMREYIESEIMDLARQCPTAVIYLKPRRHRDPVVVAEYINGHKEELRCNPFSKQELIRWINLMTTTSGRPSNQKLLKYSATSSISIQGPWNPWVYKPTEENLEELPSERLSAAKATYPTATERVLDMVKTSQPR